MDSLEDLKNATDPHNYIDEVYQLILTQDQLKQYWDFLYDMSLGRQSGWTDKDRSDYDKLKEKTIKLENRIFYRECIKTKPLRNVIMDHFMTIDEPTPKHRRYAQDFPNQESDIALVWALKRKLIKISKVMIYN